MTVLTVGGNQIHAGFQRAVKWCEANGKRQAQGAFRDAHHHLNGVA